MTNQGPEATPTSTTFESEHQLAPLGDNFEARAKRAEAIASVLLNEVGALDSVLPVSSIKMRGVRRVTQETLDTYRDAGLVEQRKQWELDEINSELESGY